MKLIFENRFKKFGFYFCLSMFLIILYFAVNNFIIGMYYWSVFYFTFLIINCVIFYIFTKVALQIAINLFFVFYTALAYINALFCYEIFPSAFFYFIPLIMAFRVNYKLKFLYFYLAFLIVIVFLIPFISNFIKQFVQYDWYFLPSNDDLIFNYILDFINAFIISTAIYSFSRELKKEKLEQKYLFTVGNKSARENNLKKITFITGLPENQEYENELEKLFFIIKKVIEKEMVYQDYKYDILMLSKRLNIGKKDIINALNYHQTGLDFDEILDFYRYKTVKKAFDKGLQANISLKEIYTAAGFKYQSKFIAVFRYFEGMSPEEFMIKNYSAMV